MPRGSPNKLVINTLIQTFQQELKPAKVYDALRKMQDDLSKTYETLFEGPLPAVDGNALLRINALNIEGIIPRANLPEEIAYEDEVNTFLMDQFIEGEELSFSLAFNNGTDPITTRLRAGIFSESKFFFSHNMDVDTGAYVRDDDDVWSAGMEFEEEEIRLFSYSETTAEPVDGEFFYTFFFKGKQILFNNVAQDDQFSMILVDDDDVTRVGEDCDITGLPNGHFAIPAKDDTELPTADPTADGIIIIDKVNTAFCFYANGNRYQVIGTPF